MLTRRRRTCLRLLQTPGLDRDLYRYAVTLDPGAGAGRGKGAAKKAAAPGGLTGPRTFTLLAEDVSAACSVVLLLHVSLAIQIAPPVLLPPPPSAPSPFLSPRCWCPEL